MTPLALASGPSTTCSLSITASKPASSATWAHRTSSGRSRPEVRVQFSLRIISIRGAVTIAEPLSDKIRDCCGILAPATNRTDGRAGGEDDEGQEHQDVTEYAQPPG